MFSNPARKDQQLKAIQHCCHRAYRFPHLVTEHHNRKPRASVSGARFQQSSHLAALSRNAYKSCLMIEEMVKLLRGAGLVAQQVQQESRIKIAAARPHHDAAGRGESHGGFNRAAIHDGAHAGAIPQMRHHSSAREVWSKRMHDGFTGEPMEPISPYSLLPDTT